MNPNILNNSLCQVAVKVYLGIDYLHHGYVTSDATRGGLATPGNDLAPPQRKISFNDFK